MALRRATGVWIEQGVVWTLNAEDRPGLETATIQLRVYDFLDDLAAVLPHEVVTIEWPAAGDTHAIRMGGGTYGHWHAQQATAPVRLSEGPHSADVFAVRSGAEDYLTIEGQALWGWQGEFYWAPATMAAAAVAAQAAAARAYTSAAWSMAEAARRKDQQEMMARQTLEQKRRDARQPLYEVDGYKLERRRNALWIQSKFYLAVRLSEPFLKQHPALHHLAHFVRHRGGTPAADDRELWIPIKRAMYERLASPVVGSAECVTINPRTMIWFVGGKAYATSRNLTASDVEAAFRDDDDAPGHETETPSELGAEESLDKKLWFAEKHLLQVSVDMDGVGLHWSCAGRRGGRRRRCEEPDATVKATVYGELERLRSTTPMLLARDEHGGRTLWWYRDGYWWDDEGLTAEEVGLLLFDRERKREARFDRLRKIRAREEDLAGARRERIPDEVRAFVWERDEGRCVRCGAEDDLQFDHVIPVAKGGGVAAGNIQIMCGDCNRAKSDSIA